ncbi:MAG: hypothetical protein Fur0043_13340 [Anaerolineales bacterium]
MKNQPFLAENHLSYRKHRRQLWQQILLPFLLTLSLVILVAVLTSLAAFREGGEVLRWAAISTIWLVIPLMGFGLLLLALLLGLIYLLARAFQVIPSYSAKAQYYVNHVASKTRRISDMSVRPIFFVEGIVASLKRLLGR